jgi:hypothetical protein
MDYENRRGLRYRHKIALASAIVMIIVVVLIALLVVMIARWIRSSQHHKKRKPCPKPDPDPPSPCAIPATTPPIPTHVIGTCSQFPALYQLSANGETISPTLSIPAGAQNVLVMVHGYGASCLEMIPLAQVFQGATKPDSDSGYYAAILLFEYNPYSCTVESMASALVSLLKQKVSSSVTLDIACHSLGCPISRWAVEQLNLGASFDLNAVYMFEGANYCVPDTLTAPVVPLIVDTIELGVLANDPTCLAALAPVFQSENGGSACNKGNASNNPPSFWNVLNTAAASPVSSTIKYFALGGNSYSDGLLGWPIGTGLAVNTIYATLGDGTSDGVLSTNSCHGLGVLEVKSDFLASYGAPPNVVRPTLHHDHLTMVGLSVLDISPINIATNVVPADVQSVITEWLMIAYP